VEEEEIRGLLMKMKLFGKVEASTQARIARVRRLKLVIAVFERLVRRKKTFFQFFSSTRKKLGKSG
jgi:hypothetical protein